MRFLVFKDYDLHYASSIEIAIFEHVEDTKLLQPFSARFYRSATMCQPVAMLGKVMGVVPVYCLSDWKIMLTYLPLDKMATVLQVIFSEALLWMSK